MAATVTTNSHTMSPREGDFDQNPQDFLDGLMRDLDFGSEGAVFKPTEKPKAPAMEGLKVLSHNKAAGSPTKSPTINVVPETPEMSVEPLHPKTAPRSEELSWNTVVRKTRGVHNAKKQWMKRSDVKPRSESLTGENGEPLTQAEYEVRRLDQRKRELVGRTVEGELIPREKGKGYFIKWNRWRHDRVFMSCAVVESVLGPRPKPGTMIRCTINRLGPDHVPWNRQNPVSNEIEHWYIRPSGFMYPQPGQNQGHNQVQSHSAQPWEYAGVHERLSQTYPPMGYNESSMRSATSYSGNSYVSPNRSPVGSYRGQRSTALQPDARFSFADRPQGRSNRANSWRSPAISRRGSEQSLLGPSSMVRMDSPISPRFQRPGRSTSTGSLVRSNTERSKESQRSTGSNGSQN